MTSRPVGQEGHCFLVVCSSPWPRKEFDWNGDVAAMSHAADRHSTDLQLFTIMFLE